jgi:hypothetical protein
MAKHVSTTDHMAPYAFCPIGGLVQLIILLTGSKIWGNLTCAISEGDRAHVVRTYDANHDGAIPY